MLILTTIRLWLKDFVPGWDDEDLEIGLEKVRRAGPGGTAWLTQRQMLAVKSHRAVHDHVPKVFPTV